MASRTSKVPRRPTRASSGKSVAKKSASARKPVAAKGPAEDARRLSPKDVATVLRLLKDSGSVELKLTVPAEGHRAAARSIGLDAVEAQPRQAYFFDTPDLALNKAGIIVRARRFQGGKGDTVVKVRPVDPAKIDPELRRSESFKVELDAMPGEPTTFSLILPAPR